MPKWKRNWFTGRYSDGPDSFILKPEGPAGDIIYSNAGGQYRIPYEYSSAPFLFAIWGNFARRIDDPGAEVTKEECLAIFETLRAAIREVDRREVEY